MIVVEEVMTFKKQLSIGLASILLGDSVIMEVLTSFLLMCDFGGGHG